MSLPFLGRTDDPHPRATPGRARECVAVEWNIAEAVGALAVYCLDRGVTPAAVHENEAHLHDFQASLRRRGIPLEWPEEQRLTPRAKLFAVVE